MHSLHHEEDPSPAQAIASALDTAGNRATSIVPPGYESYLRLLNPIELRDGSTVLWTEAVQRNGLDPRPWMQWDEFAATPGVILPDGDGQPEMGNPHASLATALIEALRVDDSTHFFASWAGYSSEFPGPVVMFSPSQRDMVLYSGSLLDEQEAPLVPRTVTGRVPMYWWPGDLSWCVGQDIYARSLVVGCDQNTARAILASPNLDAYPIRDGDAALGGDF